MKTTKNTFLILSVASILASLPFSGSSYKATVARAQNAQDNADSYYKGDDLNGLAFTGDLLSYKGDEKGGGAQRTINKDKEQLSNSFYNSFSYNGANYYRITDEHGNKIGVSETKKNTLKWGWFDCYAMDIFDYCCIYYRTYSETKFNDIHTPKYGDSFGYDIQKGNTLGLNLSTDASIGSGFGGFVKAGIKFHFEQTMEVETTFGISTTYEVNDDYVNQHKHIFSGLVETYIEYAVLTFTHNYGGGSWFNAPNIQLVGVPTIQVRRQLLYTETFCLEGSRY